jgi:uroporphyrinogen decarboxylase
VLNPLQPEAEDMDPRQIKAEFGERLCFHGAVGLQQNLPRGTPEQVSQEVQTVLDSLAPGGGYFACTAHNIQADVPVENILALLGAYRQYGTYGWEHPVFVG